MGRLGQPGEWNGLLRLLLAESEAVLKHHVSLRAAEQMGGDGGQLLMGIFQDQL